MYHDGYDNKVNCHFRSKKTRFRFCTYKHLIQFVYIKLFYSEKIFKLNFDEMALLIIKLLKKKYSLKNFMMNLLYFMYKLNLTVVIYKILIMIFKTKV